MDFPFIIFLIIGWIIFSNVKKAGKGLEKAAKHSGLGRDQLADIQAKIKEAALRNEFETSPELRGARKDDASSMPWGDMSPTQRGRERARQQGSYPGAKDTLQKRLDAASFGHSSRTTGKKSTAHNQGSGNAKKFQPFKQGSERRQKARGIGRREDFGLSSRHAPQKDQNRNRRDDWGQRGGGEIISTRNILIALALGFIVLYVLSKVSPSDLGL